MKRIVAATIVAKNYLSFGRVLAQSFRRFHPDIPFVILLADQPDGLVVEEDESFTLLQLDQLALHSGTAMRFRYQQQAFSYALTPFLLAYLLEQGFDAVAFFKQESLVLADLTAILNDIATLPEW
jgi:hypothetical protein